MQSARLDMALRMGIVPLPDPGSILVYAPTASDDLSMLPRTRCAIVTGFKPDFDHFAAQGYSVYPNWADAPPCDLVIICLPRAKDAARAALAKGAAHLRAGGRMVLDGQKTDGIGAALKDLSGIGTDLGEVVSKAHGKLAVFAPPPIPQDWAATPRWVEGDFITDVGVFSADGPDPASVLLANTLPANLPARVADFGAGWGYLSRAILSRSGVASLDLIEAGHAALMCARQNIQDARAAFHWADATQIKPPQPWDCVVMNPPFHAQRSPDAGLGLAFIRAAHARLAPHGQLWLVANRQLPYTAPVRALFRAVDEIGNDPRFRLIRAMGPLRAPKG